MSAIEDRVTTRTVRGGGNLRLHVREWGEPDAPPILFIHGWSQNHLCWSAQYESSLRDSFRLIAYDLRGHGMSDAPTRAEHYTDDRVWADDVRAIISELDLDGVVLVGWSYGAFVICDYLRVNGAHRIAAVNLVRRRDQARPFRLRNPDRTRLPRSLCRSHRRRPVGQHPRSPRLPAGLHSGATRTSRNSRPALCWNMVVPASIRAHLAAREIDDDDVLETLDMPVLVTQGRADSVVLPAMAEHILAICPNATASWYDGVGHMPHAEAPERFNRELATLATRVPA